MDTGLFIIILIIIAVVALFVIPRWRFKRAVSQVIQIFRDFNAFDTRHARTIDELGLRRRTLMEGMLKGRDYKPKALDALINAGIIGVTEDGKLYLSEQALIDAGLFKL